MGYSGYSASQLHFNCTQITIAPQMHPKCTPNTPQMHPKYTPARRERAKRGVGSGDEEKELDEEEKTGGEGKEGWREEKEQEERGG